VASAHYQIKQTRTTISKRLETTQGEKVESLDLLTLRKHYQSGTLTPRDVVATLYERIRQRGNDGTWITLVPETDALERAHALENKTDLPLYGVPFAVKDNIDVVGLPTTAACPDFSYTPGEHATVVKKLLEAGAILIGKTNMDQFATGLVGVRSPYGPGRNAFHPDYISGGSSAGSGVAVAAGLVSFSLGTDTAGSGRIPAAFNNIVGLKPTRGRISAKGVVPACQSLDCVSIFALTAHDALAVLNVAGGYDAADPYSRVAPSTSKRFPASFRFGIIESEQLQTFSDEGFAKAYEEAIHRLEKLGGKAVTIDYQPFRDTAELLYGGPWLSERVSAIEPFYKEHEDSLHPVLKTILGKAEAYRATDVFHAEHQLAALQQKTKPVWSEIDVLLTPTASRIFTIEEVEANPIALNTELGFYTNFVNLLDLSAVALPAGFGENQLPFGITLVAPAWSDEKLSVLGEAFRQLTDLQLGATKFSLQGSSPFIQHTSNDAVHVAVVGAHLSGQPLNYQLTERGGVLLQTTRTAASYQLFALGTTPAKPGLVRVSRGGSSIEVEIWELSKEAFGSFVAEVPSPLSIGTLTLQSGKEIKGFLCEPWALENAKNITALGGWRAYLATL
jgi:allophanate hydrolase